MKTFQFILILFSGIVISGCQKSGDDLAIAKGNDYNLKSKENGQNTIPFKSDFYTQRNYDVNLVGWCTEDPFLTFNYQVGEGNATHLGKFTTTMQFCVNGFQYKNGEGVFIAANGDELYFNIPSEGEVGQIFTIEHPLYELQFQDPFEFTGGTGRFEGASGGGYTNSFVDLFDDDGNFIPDHNTDHEWNGTLILPVNNQ